MRRDNQLRVTPRGTQRRRCETPLCSLAARENEFAVADRHAMQLGRVVQAQQPALHLAALGELGDHRSQMPPCSLDPAGWLELGKESNNHAPSLPTAESEGKARFTARRYENVRIDARRN